MLDIQLIRDDPEGVKIKASQKGYDIDTAKLLQLDEQRRQQLSDIEKLRAERNELTAATKGQKPSDEQIAKGKELREKVQALEEDLAQTDQEYWPLLKSVPNMPLAEVPVGKSEDENVVAKTWGQKPELVNPKNHWEIAEAKGWLDKERAAKIAGNRFVYLKGDLVLMEFALWQYGLSVLTNPDTLQQIIDDNDLRVTNKPFTPVLPPAVARTEVFEATGRLNKLEQTYKLEDEDLWLNASAEHTLSPMYMNEIIDSKELPVRLVGYTTAFRREAGTYGKDTEGFLRLHQFNKLEMECFTDAASSYQEHLFLVAIQEYLMQQLGLHHQVIEKCTADIGRPNAKGVDINVWLPGQGQYRETHTADYITDFQTRPMKTRVRQADGSVELAHTNDATAFSERPLIAIIENFQTPEGDVVVPEVLRPFMGGRERI